MSDPAQPILGLAHPCVVLFGAGASRGGLEAQPIPPPVDVDFFLVANQLTGHGTPRLARKVLKSVWELYGKVDGVALEEYYREIETRAAIGRIARSVGKPMDWAKRKSDLEELIRRVYVQTTTKEAAQGRKPCRSKCHRAILKVLKSDSTILTFNYDLVIEESFTSGKRWNPANGYGMRLSGSTLDWARRWAEARRVPSGAESEVLLLKLHGSLGWAPYSNRVVKLKSRPYLVRTGKVESVSVLPPGWNKRIDLNPYRRFWGKARLRLEQCKSLLIIGYSLPETDLLARALFSEVVRIRQGGSNFLAQLVLVDPNPNVRAKFVRLLTPALGPHARVFQFDKMQQLVPRLPHRGKAL